LRFFGKTTFYGKIVKNSDPKVFTASPIDVVVFKFFEMLPTGNRRNRALFTEQKTKLCLPPKLSLLRGSRPKSVRVNLQQYHVQRHIFALTDFCPHRFF